MATDFDREEALTEHNRRTQDLSEAEKNAYNDGYLWASADAVTVFSDILNQEISNAEKIDLMEGAVVQAVHPILLASMMTGKNYLQ